MRVKPPGTLVHSKAHRQYWPFGRPLDTGLEYSGHSLRQETPRNSKSSVGGISAGPDGKLWVTESTGNKTGRIIP